MLCIPRALSLSSYMIAGSRDGRLKTQPSFGPFTAAAAEKRAADEKKKDFLWETRDSMGP